MVPFKHRGKYLCFFCVSEMENYEHLKEHNKSHLPCSENDQPIKVIKGSEFEIKVDVSDLVCNICSDCFPSIKEIGTHLACKHRMPYDQNAPVSLTPYSLKDYKCLICGEDFKYFRNLIRHMNKSHPNKCYECNKCDQKFNKKRDMWSHFRYYHKEDYTCSICSRNFATNAELVRHKKREHISQCNLCFKIFSSFKNRLEHMKYEHNIEGGDCGFCHKHFRTRNGFLDHAAKCSVGDLSKTEARTIIVEDGDTRQSVHDLRKSIAYVINASTAMPFKFFHNRFRCFYCPKEFGKCEDLKQHTKSEHPVCDTKFKCMKLKGRGDGNKIKIDVAKLYCTLCFDQVNSFDGLVKHLESDHKASVGNCVDIFLPFELMDDKYPCPDCGEKYTYFGLLLNHVNEKHSGNKFICMYCGQPYRTAAALRSHVARRHNSTACLKCPKCDLVFKTQSFLNQHMGKAHDVKALKCSECPEKFATHYAKMRHMIKAHGGGHKCSHCGRVFIKYSFMVNHMRRTHLKEKNVECTVCNERFFDMHLLKMHMVKHSGDRIFKCDYCDKKFLRKKNLRGHVALHLKNNHVLNNGQIEAL